MATSKGPFLGPALTTISENLEGFSGEKSSFYLTKSNSCDILCLQETHRTLNNDRTTIDGMKLILKITSHVYGMYTKPNLIIESCHLTEVNNIEIRTVELSNCTITSVYKPPSAKLCFTPPANFNNQPNQIVLGDFNSHYSK